MLNIIISAVDKAFSIAFRWLDQNLISNFLNFVKGFEFAIIAIVAIVFLLAGVYDNVFGRETVIDGLRQTFATYDAAESYARLYSKIYERQQYKFRVIGNFL